MNEITLDDLRVLVESLDDNKIIPQKQPEHKTLVDDGVREIQDNVKNLYEEIRINEEKIAAEKAELEKKTLVESSVELLPEKREDPLLSDRVDSLAKLQENQKLLISRLQRQLGSLGGGGEVRLEFLDDVNRDSAKVDGKVLAWDQTSGKFIGTTISTGIAGIDTTGTSTFNIINASTATFSGNISVAGTVTYDDVTNVDSVGVITARSGIHVSGAAIFKGGLFEKYQTGTTLASDNTLALSDGNVIRRTSNESGNQTVNFTGVHSTLSNGEVVSFTVIITPNGSGVINAVQIDGEAITIKWSGGSVPSAGSSGRDIYHFSIFKTGTGVSDYEVYGAATNYA